MNLVGKEQILKGLAEVRSGQTFSLSLPLDYGNNASASRKRRSSMERSASGHRQTFCGLILASTIGAKLEHVPYKGSSQAIVYLLAGTSIRSLLQRAHSTP